MLTLYLQNNGLTDAIPSELGNLTDLDQLDLENNQLSGAIPASLANLTNPEYIRFKGNQLSGCIPESLGASTFSDLDDLKLPRCDDNPPAPEGGSVSLFDGTFSIGWNAVESANEYRAQYRTGGSESSWTDLVATTDTDQTFSPTGGPSCGTTYEFRVLAHGDGVSLVAEWSEASGAVSETTDACPQAPTFDPGSYDFSIAEDAGVGDLLGSVSATYPIRPKRCPTR